MRLKNPGPRRFKEKRETRNVAKIEEFVTTGRRKTAVASVRLSAGDGKMCINGRELKDYFPTVSVRNFILQPLKLTNTDAKFDVKAKITGGGGVGQAGALRHGISRALIRAEASLREVLKNSGFLTRDSRKKERQKSGQPGARKRFQFSKR